MIRANLAKAENIIVNSDWWVDFSVLFLDFLNVSINFASTANKKL